MEPEISEVELDKIDKKQVTESYKKNKVDPRCKEVVLHIPTTSTEITNRWNIFVASTTLHGLQYVFAGRTLVRRILWALLLLAALVWFSFQSSKLLRKYFSYPVMAKVSLEYEDSPEFPAVTICNFNKFKKSVILANGYDNEAGIFERQLFGLASENDTIDLKRYDHLNLTAFHFIAGHQINDTLVACIWGGKMCDFRSFTPVLTDMGLCHTFNSGKNSEQILKVKQAGSNHGLHLILNVRQEEYYGVMSAVAGLKVFIHRQDTLPIVSQLGFAVGTGSSIFAAIRKQRVLNLPSPYESKCFNETVNIPGYPKYTIDSCLMVCQTKFVVEKCGCRLDGMSDKDNAKVCSLRESANCLLREQNNLYQFKDYQCDCPVPCDTVSFKPVLSYATFPSESHVQRWARMFSSDKLTLSPDIIKQSEEYMRRNMLELRVYFQELSHQVIQETPAYDSESLLGEIGGQVGLCIGASLLTVLEFIDVIFSIIKIRLGFR